MRRTAFLALLLSACGGAQGGPRDSGKAPERSADPTDTEPLNGQVDDEVRLELAQTLIDHGAHGTAMPILRDTLTRHPEDPRLHLLLGTVLRDRGVYDQAERELNLALKLKPGMAEAVDGLGILYDLKGDHDAAKKAHDDAIALAPQEPKYRNNLGFSRYLAGNHEEAVAAYQEALRLDPAARTVYVNLGFALAAQGKDDEALRMFRQSGTEAEALNNLGLAHELRGDAERARRLYHEALIHDPDLGVAVGNLRALDKQASGAPHEAAP
jgi:Flp pilus assembly protein TadD